jgi:nucleoid-associated protein EbfC
MDFKADLGNIMQEAQKMQERMQKAQEELANTVVEGVAGAGLVKVTLNGKHECTAVKINPNLQDEDIDMLEDLVRGAFNDAVKKVEGESRAKINELTQGLKLPEGLDLPTGGGKSGQDD